MKRTMAILMAVLMLAGILSGCVKVNTEVTPTPEATKAPAPAEATATPVADPLATDQAVTLNLSVFYNNTVYMRYTVDGAEGRPQSEYVAANGKTYREGDFKPVWEELQSRLNFTINDVTPTDAKDVRASFTTLQAQNFANVDIMVGNSVDLNQEGTLNNTYVKLDEYLDIMPNFKAFLDNNSVVKTSITSGDGHIYYAPYFDGYDDIERMFILRADWVQKLLDDDTAVYNTDRTVKPFYKPYMPESVNVELTVAKADGSGTQTIRKAYTKNVITAQNELPKMDGAGLVQVLKAHIDSTYGGAFAKRSDLFIGQDAAYDADELVALMRCVLANTELLTGQSEYDAVPFYPRGYQMGRVQDLFRLAEIWGVRGLDSRLGWLYFDNNGELQDARYDAKNMDALERLNQLYKENLILQDFDKNESTAGLAGSDHRERLNKANLGFLTYDYNQTTTVLNSIEKTIPDFNLTPVLPPVADWDNNGNYYQFTDSWRSVKSDGWSILASIASDDAKLKRALKLFDYLYSPEGNQLMSYGPDAWIDGEIMYGGKLVPKLSEAALTELGTLAKGNYTNYYRMWLGATFPIGYVKEQGMEYQTVHPKGQAGLDIILKACELGTMKHLQVNAADAASPAEVIVPSTFSLAEAEEQFIRDNCADLNTAFRNGNNDTDRILFVDYVLYGFEGKNANKDKLLSKEGLIEYLMTTLNGEGHLTMHRSAYERMTGN